MEVLILLITLLCVVCLGYDQAWEESKKEQMGIFPDPSAEALLREAASVVSDFLEAGRVVSILSGDLYQGTISVRAHPHTNSKLKYQIFMYGSGDLQNSYQEYRKANPDIFRKEPEAFRELENFLDTYGKCYDPERDSLVYATVHTVKKNQKEKIEAELSGRISLHPLAELETLSLIHTKKTPRK